MGAASCRPSRRPRRSPMARPAGTPSTSRRSMAEPLYDFHTHSFLSDGELSPVELIRRAAVRGYRAIGIADHAGPGNVEAVVRQLVADCRLCERYWDIVALPGVELTHLPPAAIGEVARMARAAGARLVVVHGETPAEPVEPGTNLAAVSCPDVDVLGPLEAARLHAHALDVGEGVLDLDDAPLRQVEDDGAGLDRLQAGLTGPVVDDPEGRQLVRAQMLERAVDGRVVAVGVVLVEDGQ